MKVPTVNNASKLNFNGNFYYETDTHSRILEEAAVLSGFEKDITEQKYKNISSCFIHGGDFVSTILKSKSIAKLYANFAKNNPDISMYFSLGNAEMKDKNQDKISDKATRYIIKKLKKFPQIKFLSVLGINPHERLSKFVCPYAIFNDKIVLSDGKITNKKVMLIATTTEQVQDEKNLEKQKNALTKLKPSIEREKPDDIIFISHNTLNNTEYLTDFMKNKLGIKNIKLILGAHTHKALQNTKILDIPAVYPCVMGTCGVKINSSENGFRIPMIPADPNNMFNYNSPFPKIDGIFRNSDDIQINPDYLYPFVDDKKQSKFITSLKNVPKFRYEKNNGNSKRCEIGTIICNGMKKSTSADIAILLTMTFKDSFPENKKKINMYDIKKTLSDDHHVNIIKNVTAEELLEVFKESYKKQNLGNNNRNFLEFSDNIKLVVDEKTADIKQISIDGLDILDEFGKVKNPNKKFSVATCEYLAKNAYERGFKSLDKHKLIRKNVVLSEILANELIRMNND